MKTISTILTYGMFLLLFNACQNNKPKKYVSQLPQDGKIKPNRYNLIFTRALPKGDRTDTLVFYETNDSTAYLYGLIQRDGYDSTGAKLSGTAYNYSILDSSFREVKGLLKQNTIFNIEIKAKEFIQPGKRKNRENGIIPLIDSTIK